MHHLFMKISTRKTIRHPLQNPITHWRIEYIYYAWGFGKSRAFYECSTLREANIYIRRLITLHEFNARKRRPLGLSKHQWENRLWAARRICENMKSLKSVRLYKVETVTTLIKRGIKP